jgi:hypothetical protein
VGLEASCRLAGKAHDRGSAPKRVPASVLSTRPGRRACRVAAQALADAALLAGNGAEAEPVPATLGEGDQPSAPRGGPSAQAHDGPLTRLLLPLEQPGVCGSAQMPGREGADALSSLFKQLGLPAYRFKGCALDEGNRLIGDDPHVEHPPVLAGRRRRLASSSDQALATEGSSAGFVSAAAGEGPTTPSAHAEGTTGGGASAWRNGRHGPAVRHRARGQSRRPCRPAEQGTRLATHRAWLIDWSLCRRRLHGATATL